MEGKWKDRGRKRETYTNRYRIIYGETERKEEKLRIYKEIYREQ